ncbi:MAG: response regulator receiver [Gemmatimonadetes bacterium]|nr:response regulator receiver [Gemmatimonadota bacterium]
MNAQLAAPRARGTILPEEGNVTSPPKILIVEDNEDLAFGLRRSLEDEGYQVDIAPDGTTGMRLALQRDPDLVVLDLMLPGALDGYRTLSALRHAKLEMPVLILTARGEESDKVHGFRLGADDYVVKPFGLSELMARIRALLRRGRPTASDEERALGFGDVSLDPRGRIVTRGGERVSLTPKEFDLLFALLRRPGAVLSRVSLLREVWGHNADVMTRTVDIHVGELRRKLELEPATPRHIMTVRKVGYRFDP